MIYEGLLAEIFTCGMARRRLTSAGDLAVSQVREAAAKFFCLPPEQKLQQLCEHGIDGYWPYGSRWAAKPSWPDQDEVFAVRGATPVSLPATTPAAILRNALVGWRAVAAGTVAMILDELADHYHYPDTLDFVPYSHAEVTWYGTPDRRAWPFLQERHEDGHLLTLTVVTAPGLEIEHDGGDMMNEPGDPGTLLIMPGATMTAMTGGRIKPVFHRTVNLNLLGRATVTYFVDLSPEPGTVRPYLLNRISDGLDMAVVAQQNCANRTDRRRKLAWTPGFPNLRAGEHLREIEGVAVPAAADPPAPITGPVVGDGEPLTGPDCGHCPGVLRAAVVTACLQRHSRPLRERRLNDMPPSATHYCSPLSPHSGRVFPGSTQPTRTGPPQTATIGAYEQGLPGGRN
jgi:isopenicillin N synthase-like dioxygenase